MTDDRERRARLGLQEAKKNSDEAPFPRAEFIDVVRDLLALATEQAQTIRELEQRLNDGKR